MSSSPNESKALCDYLGIEEEVDYGSNTSVRGASAPPAQYAASGSDETIITNPLDMQQQLLVQREEKAQRHVQMATTLERQRDYVFTPPSVEERLRQAAGQTLATWVIGHGP
uniref:Uncharacterized protein n=1 Tax=Peronospora matthiolae TaxID=2874970 RepID=A0AAV1UY12_9STRA